MLPGDLILRALRSVRRRRDFALPLEADDQERERGSLDPQTVAEFLAYDVPFRTPPAEGFDFPPEAHDG